MIGRGGYLGAMLAAALMAADDRRPIHRGQPKTQTPAKPSSNRKADLLAKALSRKARWEK